MAVGTEVGRIFYALDLDSSRFRAGLEVAGDEAEGFGGHLTKIAKVAAEAFVIAAGAAAAFAAESVKAYAESEAIGAQLNQVLQTTGKASQISRDEVEKLAMSMERYSGKSHDAIEQGQTLLLQFSQVTKENLPQFTKAMLDLSQRMGVDTVTAAKQLGIALDDPTTGMARLRRSGIDFTKSQKEAIKALQDSGDIAGADALLMQALNDKVGGAAGAYRDTLSGSIASAKNSLHDFEIQVGRTISNALEPLAKKAANALAAIDWQTVVQNTTRAITDFWNKLVPIADTVMDVATRVWNFLEPSLSALWNTIETKVVPTLLLLWHQVIEPLLPIIGTILVAAVWLVINALNIFLSVITPLMDFLLTHKYILEVLAGAFLGLAAAMAFNAIFDALTVGFTTLRLVTIPSTMASVEAFRALIASPIGMVIVVGAALAALDAVYQKGQQTIALLQKLNQQEASDYNSESGAMKSVIDAYHAGKISQAQYQAFFKNISARASGGPVAGGTPYVVGEQGPELWVPRMSGYIVPNNVLAGLTNGMNSMGSGFGKSGDSHDTYVNNHIGNINITKDADGEAIVAKLTRSDQLISMGLSG